VPPAEHEPDLISLFVAPLNALGLTYMVTGAVAAIVYGEPRLTNDIDIVIAIDNESVAQLSRAFDPSDFYVPPIEIMAMEANRPVYGHFNLIHTATSLKADVYPAGTDPLHAWALARRQQIRVAGESVWIAPIEYVVLRKLEHLRDGGSDKHRRDIRAMLREAGNGVDTAALLLEVERRGLTSEWSGVVEGRTSGE
jgi:hypothetical protein